MRLYLINGPCGVGKSAVASELQKILPKANLIELDLVRDGIPAEDFTNGGVINATARMRHADCLAQKIAMSALARGADVVLDAVMYRNEWLDEWQNLGNSLGVPVIEVCLMTSKEIVMNRATARGFRSGGRLTPQKVLDIYDLVAKLYHHRTAHIIDNASLAPEDVAKQIRDFGESQSAAHKSISRILRNELSASVCPVTNRSIACVLMSGGRLYSDHNYEYSSNRIQHAEVGALAKVPANEKIEAIFITGQGQKKIRKVAPCFDCYEALLPRLSHDYRLVLFDPVKAGELIMFTSVEVAAAYKTRPYTKIEGKDVASIDEELKQLTPLNPTDRSFVTNVRLENLSGNVKVYLTRSSSGRGWISQAVNEKQGYSYGCVCLLVNYESEEQNMRCEEQMRKLVLSHYDNVSIEAVSSKARWQSTTIEGTRFSSGGKKVVEIMFALDFRKGFTKKGLCERNFFIEIA